MGSSVTPMRTASPFAKSSTRAVLS